MASPDSTPARTCAVRLILIGRVQGWGIRPALYRLATRLGLAGQVGNTVRGVEVELEGEASRVADFEQQLPAAIPRGSHLEEVLREPLGVRGRMAFTIQRENAAGPVSARLPADLVVCGECLREVGDPKNRRYRYPFTSCTLCGPRYSLLSRMPYERSDTSMAPFRLCEFCQREYQDPSDRRFHSQTQACPNCGPRIRLVFARREDQHLVLHAPMSQLTEGQDPAKTRPTSVMYTGRSGEHESGEEALRAALHVLREGKILALRGVGGYQLLVDATNAAAVRRLRERKHRHHKPLAVMVRSSEAGERLAYLNPRERQSLEDRSNPIVLVRRRPAVDVRLATEVTQSGLNSVGLLLPATPLHARLAEELSIPLVCTSGNREGDPLEYETEEAETRLAGIADAWLHHDREIVRPIDDSVVRVIGGRQVTIRLGRGLAPWSLSLPLGRVLPTLALGGHMKVAAAWCNERQAVLGPHLGDLDSPANRQRLIEQLSGWQQLFEFCPERLVHDRHPDYFTTQWAKQQAEPSLAVQHHHAHVVSGMLDHGWLDRQVLGVAWDGTGYGNDETIWGGEFLIASVRGFRRWGNLRPFRLPGGSAAIYELWRGTLSVLDQVLGRNRLDDIPLAGVTRAQRQAMYTVLEHPQFAPRTTSAGRLFDVAACLILDLPRARYEGEPAMLLEAVADPQETSAYAWPLVPGATFELDWRPLIAELLADRRAGVSPAVMSARFHRALARGIVAMARTQPQLPVLLSGGVFQNRLLTEWVLEEWPEGQGPPALPGGIPPNDGGLAAGQLAIAVASADAIDSTAHFG